MRSAAPGRLLAVEGHLDLAGVVAEACGELGDGSEADQPTGGEDADPVAHRLDLGEQVAREEHGHAALADEIAQELEDLDHADRVDRRRRLVQDQDVGVLDEGIGDAEPLEHAAGVGVGAAVSSVGETHLAERRLDPGFRLLAAQSVEPRRVAQVLRPVRSP